MPEERGEALVGHTVHIRAAVDVKLRRGVFIEGCLTAHVHRVHEPKIAAGRADAELILALFHDPAVFGAAPNGEAPLAEREKDGLFFAGQQFHAREARERERRAQHAGGFAADIELRDLRPGAAAGVLHRKAHAAGRKFAGRVGKLRIA